MGKVLIKLAVAALAAVGVYALYVQYGKRVRRLQGPAEEFVNRASSAVQEAGHTVGQAGNQAADAIEHAAERIADAATAAGREAASEFGGESQDAAIPSAPGTAEIAPAPADVRS
jgi:hypothetical protein